MWYEKEVTSLILIISANFACAAYDIMKCFISLMHCFSSRQNMWWSCDTDTVIWKLAVMAWASYQIRKIAVAHAPGMPGTFSPPPSSKETASKRSRHASRHVRHARAVMHVGIANPRWRGKRSRHSGRMRNPQFYVSGKRPMVLYHVWVFWLQKLSWVMYMILMINTMKAMPSHCIFKQHK